MDILRIMKEADIASLTIMPVIGFKLDRFTFQSTHFTKDGFKFCTEFMVTKEFIDDYKIIDEAIISQIKFQAESFIKAGALK